MSNLCRVSGKFVCNIHEGKGGKGGTKSLWELTAGAEKGDPCRVQEMTPTAMRNRHFFGLLYGLPSREYLNIHLFINTHK